MTLGERGTELKHSPTGSNVAVRVLGMTNDHRTVRWQGTTWLGYSS
jgi:hypothetical protein